MKGEAEMTRSEILQIAKPILFNTEMVRAILDGRKTVTRRAIKDKDITNHFDIDTDGSVIAYTNPLTGDHYPPSYPCRYKPGDYLYVPEAWKCTAIYKTHGYNTYGYEVEYKDGTEYYFEFLNKERFKKFEKYLDKPEHQWQSPYFMPKEAARIFLRVTDVRVERLQEIDYEGCKAEGIWDGYETYSKKYHENLARVAYVKFFSELWDSTIPPKDRDKYGWAANPYVFVISFERIFPKERENA